MTKTNITSIASHIASAKAQEAIEKAVDQAVETSQNSVIPDAVDFITSDDTDNTKESTMTTSTNVNDAINKAAEARAEEIRKNFDIMGAPDIEDMEDIDAKPIVETMEVPCDDIPWSTKTVTVVKHPKFNDPRDFMQYICKQAQVKLDKRQVKISKLGIITIRTSYEKSMALADFMYTQMPEQEFNMSPTALVISPRKKKAPTKPISQDSAWQFFKSVCKEVGVSPVYGKRLSNFTAKTYFWVSRKHEGFDDIMIYIEQNYPAQMERSEFNRSGVKFYAK